MTSRPTFAFVILTILTLIAGCTEEEVKDFIDPPDKPSHPVDGVYVSEKAINESMFVDRNRSGQAAVIFDDKKDGYDITYLLKIEEGDNEYEVTGVCGIGFCQPIEELTIQTTQNQLFLKGNMNGQYASEKFTRVATTTPINELRGKSFFDSKLGSTLHIDNEDNVIINSLYCTISGTMIDKAYYYELAVEATGCLSPILNGYYNGVLYAVDLPSDQYKVVYALFGKQQSSLFGRFE